MSISVTIVSLNVLTTRCLILVRIIFIIFFLPGFLHRYALFLAFIYNLLSETRFTLPTTRDALVTHSFYPIPACPRFCLFFLYICIFFFFYATFASQISLNRNFGPTSWEGRHSMRTTASELFFILCEDSARMVLAVSRRRLSPPLPLPLPELCVYCAYATCLSPARA